MTEYDPNVDYGMKLTELGLDFGQPSFKVLDESDLDVQEEQGTQASGRVEFRPVGQHFLGYKEAYVVIRTYATHAETWMIVETDNEVEEPWVKKMTITEVGRDGAVWMIWHDFHATNERAAEWAAKAVQDHLMAWCEENVWTLHLG